MQSRARVALMTVSIAGFGVLGPGLPDAEACRRALTAEESYQGGAVRAPLVEGLSANEARRCPTTARYVLDVGRQALRSAGWEAAGVTTVLSSGSGDLEILDKNCRALATAPIALSPTLFHNSVHNAAGGYWGIATGSRAATTSLSAYDDSFAAGLLEALTTVAPGRPCLLIAYDLPPPAALTQVRKVSAPFAVAFALSMGAPAGSCARLSWEWGPATGEGASRMVSPVLEALRLGNPAARCLPLLRALCNGRSETLSWAYPEGGALRVATLFDA